MNPPDSLVQPFAFKAQPCEYKVVALRECPTPQDLALCDTPDKAAAYWRTHVESHPYFNPECECFTVLLLNTRRRVKAHQIVSFGTHDTILVHPLTVFRLAIVTSASALVIMHNHPSGDPRPSDSDCRATRRLASAVDALDCALLDHLVFAGTRCTSLRQLGYL
jgi:DNA repair protein RadC